MSIIDNLYSEDYSWVEDDFDQVNKLFPVENKSSVTELWLGFVDYYTNQFDYKNNVIQVFRLIPIYSDSTEILYLR